MQSTKERINKMKEQEALMDYTADIKLAVYYNLVHKEECKDPLTKLDNDYHLEVTFDGQHYTPYKKDQEIVFAYKETIFQEEGKERLEKFFVLTLPEDYKTQLENLKAQDALLNQKYLQLNNYTVPINKTRTFVIVMAWIGVTLGVLLSLDMFSYNFAGALLVLIGSLSSAAILFALAEIINLLQKK